MKRFVAIFAMIMVLCVFCSVAVMAENTMEVVPDGSTTGESHIVDLDDLIMVVKAPTCTETGIYRYTCLTEGCEDGFHDVIVEATGHTWSNRKDWGATIIAPTCTTEGLAYYDVVCTECGAVRESETRVLATIAHKYTEYVVDQEPNCKETGLAHYECSVCGAIDEDSYITLETNDDHSFSEWNIETPATCISTGLKTRVCTRCSYTEYEVIPMTDHTYEVAGMHLNDCEKITVTWVCSYCGDTYEETITGNFHNYVLVSDTATCTEGGTATYRCTYCGDEIYKDSEALGHAWSDWILSETYTQDGVEYGLYIHECTRACCDNVFQQVVMPLSEGEPENDEGDEGDAGETETVANVYAVSEQGIEVGTSAVSGTGTVLQVIGEEEVGTLYVRVAVVYENEDGEQILVVNCAEVKSDMTFNVPKVQAPYGYSVKNVCLVAVTDDAAAVSGAYAEVAAGSSTILAA